MKNYWNLGILLLSLCSLESSLGEYGARSWTTYLVGSDPESPKVYYNNEPGVWKDKVPFTDSKNVEIDAQFCFSGIWILYPLKNFRPRPDTEPQIVSGKSTCIQLGMVQSIQPVGGAEYGGETEPNTIILFQEPYFGGVGLPSYPKLSSTKSFITYGNAQWEFQLENGDTVCFGGQSGPERICRVPDISKFVGGRSVQSISLGCPEGGNTWHWQLKVNLLDCQTFGSNDPDFGERWKRSKSHNRTLEPETRYKGSNCTPTLPYTSREDLMKVIHLRMSHDFRTYLQLDWPTTAHLGNTELLDLSFDIMIATCPDQVVQTEYLQIIREFAVMRLDEDDVWKANWNVIYEFEPDLLTLLRVALSNCSHMLRAELQDDGKYLNTTFTEPILKDYLAIRDPAKVVEKVKFKDVFKPEEGREDDVVAEAAWVVGNHVAGICHHLLHKLWPNFLFIYIRAFQDFYLIPLEKAWKNPKARNQAYSFILGGFGVNRQFDRMSFCASRMIKLTKGLDPFIREYKNDIVDKGETE